MGGMLTAAVTACWAQPATATSSTPWATPINQHAAEFLFSFMQHSNHDCRLYIDNDPLPLILTAAALVSAAAGSEKQ
jgi:hypothetical protein